MGDEPIKRPGPHRWQPGESGNPSGRPAGTQEVATRIREALRERLDPDTAKELARVMVELSLSGNAKVMSLLLRTHGMLTDSLQLVGTPVGWDWTPAGAGGQPGGTAAQPAEAAGSGSGDSESETEQEDSGA